MYALAQVSRHRAGRGAPPLPEPLRELPPEWLAAQRAGGRPRRRVVSPSPDRRCRRAPRGIGERTARWRAAGSVHRLMQSLPALPAGTARRGRAQTSGSRASDFDDAEREALLREVCAILDDARFAVAVRAGQRAPRCRSSAAFQQNERVSGQVDRLVVTPKRVLIADYKIESHCTATANRRHPGDLCRASSRSTAPCWGNSIRITRVRAALVLTAGPALMELPAPLLDADCQDLRQVTVTTLRRDRSLTLSIGVHTFPPP